MPAICRDPIQKLISCCPPFPKCNGRKRYIPPCPEVDMARPRKRYEPPPPEIKPRRKRYIEISPCCPPKSNCEGTCHCCKCFPCAPPCNPPPPIEEDGLFDWYEGCEYRNVFDKEIKDDEETEKKKKKPKSKGKKGKKGKKRGVKMDTGKSEEDTTISEQLDRGDEPKLLGKSSDESEVDAGMKELSDGDSKKAVENIGDGPAVDEKEEKKKLKITKYMVGCEKFLGDLEKYKINEKVFDIPKRIKTSEDKLRKLERTIVQKRLGIVNSADLKPKKEKKRKEKPKLKPKMPKVVHNRKRHKHKKHKDKKRKGKKKPKIKPVVRKFKDLKITQIPESVMKRFYKAWISGVKQHYGDRYACPTESPEDRLRNTKKQKILVKMKERLGKLKEDEPVKEENSQNGKNNKDKAQNEKSGKDSTKQENSVKSASQKERSVKSAKNEKNAKSK